MRQLLSEITSAELSEWQAYYRIEPWGEKRADLRSGIVAATIANKLRGKSEKAHKVDEFMPEFSEGKLDTKFSDHLRGVLKQYQQKPSPGPSHKGRGDSEKIGAKKG